MCKYRKQAGSESYRLKWPLSSSSTEAFFMSEEQETALGYPAVKYVVIASLICFSFGRPCIWKLALLDTGTIWSRNPQHTRQTVMPLVSGVTSSIANIYLVYWPVWKHVLPRPSCHYLLSREVACMPVWPVVSSVWPQEASEPRHSLWDTSTWFKCKTIFHLQRLLIWNLDFMGMFHSTQWRAGLKIFHLK